jgi:hypothetical protein
VIRFIPRIPAGKKIFNIVRGYRTLIRCVINNGVTAGYGRYACFDKTLIAQFLQPFELGTPSFAADKLRLRDTGSFMNSKQNVHHMPALQKLAQFHHLPAYVIHSIYSLLFICNSIIHNVIVIINCCYEKQNVIYMSDALAVMVMKADDPPNIRL